MKTYCHLCGAKYKDGQENPWVCTGCGNKVFANPVPTVDLALFNAEGQVLVAERGQEPSKGLYDLPGGFLEVGETLEQGIIREIQEELQLTHDDYDAPVFVKSLVGPYAFGKEERQLVICVFAAQLKKSTPITAHDDVASTKFVSLGDLSSVKFSRKEYTAIIREAHKLLFG